MPPDDEGCAEGGCYAKQLLIGGCFGMDGDIRPLKWHWFFGDDCSLAVLESISLGEELREHWVGNKIGETPWCGMNVIRNKKNYIGPGVDIAWVPLERMG